MSKKRIEGDPMRNSLLDMMSAAQVCVATIRVTFQEVPMIGTYFTNIRERRKLKNILGKAATTVLNALQLLFWPYLCGEDL